MASFNKGKALHSLKHYLPSQTPLIDFIYHNSLHAFQEHSFYKAIFSASTIFGYHVTFNLNEYRRLFKTGRIREDVLDRVIEKQKNK